MKINDQVVMLTGANGGIGRAIAGELGRRGATLILVTRKPDGAADVEQQLVNTGSRVCRLSGDIAQAQVPGRLIADALRHFGHIDILINCAGVQNFGLFADEAELDTIQLMQTNAIAPMNLTRAVLPSMLQRNQGWIVNVGSIFGSIGFPCFASYSASKFALRGFSEALRRELTGSGIGVTYVAPRFTRTAFNRGAVTRMANALGMNQDEPETVAARVVAAIERGRRNAYLGWPEKLFVRVNSLIPGLVDLPLRQQMAQMRPFAIDRAR